MGAYSPYPREINIYFLRGCYIYTLPIEYRKEKSQQIKKRERTRENERKAEHL